MGQTFMEYVALRRIEAARTALESDPRTDLASLAVDLGFCDQAHFSKVFRRICGTTPRKYANQRSEA
jgi:transcriptional regulator GlxA family with amidase domain